MSSQNRETTLEVSGMTCRSCVGHVQAALRDVDGVCEVDVRMREGKVVVRHDESAAPSERLLEALAKVGYPSRTAGG